MFTPEDLRTDEDRKTPRYLCQFREFDKTYYTTDCGFNDLDQAKIYVNTIMLRLTNLCEGRVYDQESRYFMHYNGGRGVL